LIVVHNFILAFDFIWKSKNRFSGFDSFVFFLFMNEW